MADKPESAPAAPAPEPTGGGGGGNKLVMILTLVNLVVTMGIAAVVFISFKKENSQPKATDILAEDDHASAEHAAANGEHGEKASGGHGDGKDAQAGATKKTGKIMTLEQFTVNLATSGSITPKYARVNISIEVGSDDVESEMNQKLPQVRNTVIDLFNSKRPSDLGSVDGRNYLKDEIKNSINSFLVSGKVKNVFFTNFSISG